MDKYYYLISQLPMLRFGQQPPLDKSSFLEESRKWLSRKDFRELSQAGIDNLGKGGEAFLAKEYKKFELTLRRELADYRGKEGSRQQYSRTVLAENLLSGNPLEVEKKLFFCRWQKIEELCRDSVFSLEAVLAYSLKLQILEKVFGFDKEKGTKEFDSLTEVTDEEIR